MFEIPDRPDWQAKAACRGMGPEAFYPQIGQQLSADIVALCEGCRVRDYCAVHAFRTHERHGVWGGLSVKARSKHRQAARRDR